MLQAILDAGWIDESETAKLQFVGVTIGDAVAQALSDAGVMAMKHLWTIIGVEDVARSHAWYRFLLGLPDKQPAHDYFGTVESDGNVLLCLHRWGDHEHPPLASPAHATPGNGLLLFFRVGDFDDALARARTLVSALEEEPHVNPGTGTKEFALRDLDGYYVMISALPAT